MPSSGCFSIPPPQISPLLHFVSASKLLEIKKESCGGGGGGGGEGAPLTWPCLLHSHTSVGRGRK